MNRKVQQDPTGLPRMLIEKTGRQLDLEDPLTAIVYMILLFFSRFLRRMQPTRISIFSGRSDPLDHLNLYFFFKFFFFFYFCFLAINLVQLGFCGLLYRRSTM